MPTAVITASNENTASKITICATTAINPACTLLWLVCSGFPSSRSCSSVVALNSKNTPPTNKIMSRTDKSKLPKVSTGSVKVMSHDIIDNKNSRMTNAKPRPKFLALARWCGGSLLAKMAIKTRLSIPKTISRMTSVARLSHADGSDSSSNIVGQLFSCNEGQKINKQQKRKISRYLSKS